jgi:hypothetical protein
MVKVTLILPSGESKSILIDENIDVPNLKQVCCCEAASSPAYSRVYCGDQLLKGEGAASDFGVVEGATIKLQVAGV